MTFDPMEDRLSFIEGEYEKLRTALTHLLAAHENLLEFVEAMSEEEAVHHEALVSHQKILEIHNHYLSRLTGENL